MNNRLLLATSRFGTFLALASLPCLVIAQGKQPQVKNIILVHGAWADGSSWSRVIPLLDEREYNVVAVQLPLTSLQDDVNATERAIERVERETPGPVLLVGHSYGGTVITQAGTDPNVVGLVYVAAFAPDDNQSSLDLDKSYPRTPVAGEMVTDPHGFTSLTRAGVFEDFAPDLSRKEREDLFVAQGPTAGAALSTPVTIAAWKTKPSWFVIAANDRVISPELEAFEAKRMNAVTVSVPTSHVALIAVPEAVTALIELATRSFGAR